MWDPLRLQKTISVQELHEVALGPLIPQFAEARVPAARGGESAIIGQWHDLRSEPLGKSLTSVGGGRIDVNHLVRSCEDRAEARFEASPFVSADDDKSDIAQRRHRQGASLP